MFGRHSSPSQASLASTVNQPLLSSNTAPRNVAVDASVASYLRLSTGGNAMSSCGTPLSGPKTTSKPSPKPAKAASPKPTKSPKASTRSSPSSKGQETMGSFFNGF